jgi:subtilisin family serine protease
MMKRTIPFMLGVLLCLPAGAARAQDNQKFLIKVKGGTAAELASAVSAAGGTLLRVHPEIGYATAVSQDAGFASKLSANGIAETVVRDTSLQMVPAGAEIFESETVDLSTLSGASAGADPSDAALFACQWQLDRIHAPEAWAKGSFGDPGVKVAVVDTGVDPFHVDLVGRVDEANSISVLAPGSSPCGALDEDTFYDLAAHGTFMASLVTTNGVGIAAVAPQAQVVAIKALNCVGQGSTADVIAGILYAAGLPDVDAINLSLGGFVDHADQAGREEIQAIAKAVDYATHAGKLVVTVAGNQGIDLQHRQQTVGTLFPIPTESGQAVAIYATDNLDRKTNYSNYGVDATWVGAPGGNLPNLAAPRAGCPLPVPLQGLLLGACSSFVCGATDQYILGRGTSAAAPIAVGVALLVDGNHGGELKANQLKNILMQTADDLGDPGTDLIYSHGRVNAGQAADQ